MVWVVMSEERELLVEERMKGGSNNIAELLGIRDALKWVTSEMVLDDILIRTDSKVALSWLSAEKFGTHLNNKELVLEIRREIDALRKEINVEFEWVPREKNKAGWYIESKYSL